MAIYHCSFQMLSRNPRNPKKSGCNALLAAAYRSGSKLGIYDFTNKGKYGVDHSEIFTPVGAPAWAKNRYSLWQSIEEIERRKDAQLAREVNFAIPKELSTEEKIKLARQFAEYFANQGMVADLAVHKVNELNSHGHILLTTRHLGSDGWSKKNREWNSPDVLKSWRKTWAELANAALEREGFMERISHKSLKTQGIDRAPTWHIGRKGKALAEKGIETSAVMHNRIVREIDASRQEEKRLHAELLAIEEDERVRQQTSNHTIDVKESTMNQQISNNSMTPHELVKKIKNELDEWEKNASQKATQSHTSSTTDENNTMHDECMLLTHLPPTPKNLALRYKAAREILSFGDKWEKDTITLMKKIEEKSTTDPKWGLEYIKYIEQQARESFKRRKRAKKWNREYSRGPELER